MPLVRVSLARGKSTAHLRAICDGIHQGVVDTFEVPRDDRFQVVHQHGADEFVTSPEFLGIRHTGDVVLINIVVSEWRTTAQKQAL